MENIVDVINGRPLMLWRFWRYGGGRKKMGHCAEWEVTELCILELNLFAILQSDLIERDDVANLTPKNLAGIGKLLLKSN